MKILHICLCGPFTDGASYQENMLAKYHKTLGYDVYLITSKWKYNNKGDLDIVDFDNYINNDGVNIIRLNIKGNKTINSKFKRYPTLYNNLCNINPDIIFVHGCQFLDVRNIVKYAKCHNTTIYVDNHADFSNSATNFISKNFLHGIIWKHYAKKIEPYTKKFYGVLPARVNFLKSIYSLPSSKVELLVMGCDIELANAIQKEKIRNDVIKKYNFKNSDFIIITGGKIDNAKKQTLLLLEAVKQINNPKIKVLVFGSIIDELKDKVLSYCSDNIKYVGWLNHEDTYKYLLASDLAVYPGRHSVLWEETTGLGIPMIVKYWEGTTHVDVGGNVKFIKNDTVGDIKNLIEDILSRNNYKKMKQIAINDGMRIFSYKEIAKKSIEL